jgi:phage terminase large subunit-like protein
MVRRGGMTLDELLEQCDVVVVGIDGGGLDDLLGVAWSGGTRTTREWLHWGMPGRRRTCSSGARKSRRGCATSKKPAT